VFHTDKKLVNAILPVAIVDNAAVSSLVIDTLGFGYLEIAVQLGATDIALTAFKVQEADAKTNSTTLTSGADVTGTVFGTDANDTGSTSTLPSATDDNKIYKFEIDLRGRKRYLQVQATVGNGSAGAFIAAIAALSRGAQVPTSAADKGVAQLMRV
jgi:hypothetical protein